MLLSMETTLAPLYAPAAMRRLTYHLLGLPLGTAYFTWLVTGLSTGIGLAITLIGIPLLTLVLASVRPLMAAERAVANALLDAELPPVPLAPPAEGGLLRRLAAYWRDRATWRGALYLLLRFPAGTAEFCVAVTAYSAALYAIFAPIIAPFAPLELGFWRVNTVYEGLALVPFGLLALLGSAWISEGMASVSRALLRRAY
jgi:hypothetical protein